MDVIFPLTLVIPSKHIINIKFTINLSEKLN